MTDCENGDRQGQDRHKNGRWCGDRLPAIRGAVALGLTLVFAISIASSAAIAGDNKNRFQSYNPQLTCEKFVKLHNGKDSLEKTAAYWWVIGFISGVNNGLPKTFDITGKGGLFAALEKILEMCRADPNLAIKEAAAKLVQDLYPQRIKQAP